MVAQPSAYERLQHLLSQRILNDRPPSDADVPPILLLYPGFGQFLDSLDGATDIPRLDAVDGPKLQLAVDEFAQRMSRFYPYGGSRRRAALRTLEAIFAARSAGVKIPVFSVTSAGPNPGVAVAVADTAGNTPIPKIELTTYIVHSHITATATDSDQALFPRWHVPSIIGECPHPFHGAGLVHGDLRDANIV